MKLHPLPIEENEAVPIVNDLIEVCKDGQKGFKLATQAVRTRRVKNLFSQYAQQFLNFLSELKEWINQKGGNHRPTSMLGALHRGWTNIKSIATSGNEAAIVMQCAYGDGAAVEMYKEALENSLPFELQEILYRHCFELQQAHYQLCRLGKMYE